MRNLFLTTVLTDFLEKLRKIEPTLQCGASIHCEAASTTFLKGPASS